MVTCTGFDNVCDFFNTDLLKALPVLYLELRSPRKSKCLTVHLLYLVILFKLIVLILESEKKILRLLVLFVLKDYSKQAHLEVFLLSSQLLKSCFKKVFVSSKDDIF